MVQGDGPKRCQGGIRWGDQVHDSAVGGDGIGDRVAVDRVLKRRPSKQ